MEQPTENISEEGVDVEVLKQEYLNAYDSGETKDNLREKRMQLETALSVARASDEELSNSEAELKQAIVTAVESDSKYKELYEKAMEQVSQGTGRKRVTADSSTVGHGR